MSSLFKTTILCGHNNIALIYLSPLRKSPLINSVMKHAIDIILTYIFITKISLRADCSSSVTFLLANLLYNSHLLPVHAQQIILIIVTA